MRHISVAIIAFLISATAAYAETPAEKWDRISGELSFLSTHDGFLYWLGLMAYDSEACGVRPPDAGIDFFARRAGVSKEEAAKQGPGSPMAEGYKDAARVAKQIGLGTICERYRVNLDKMHANGLY